MTTSLRDVLSEIEGALTDARCSANTNRVLVDAFFPDAIARYPIWAHDCDAMAFRYLADDLIDRIDRVQALVDAHCPEKREASS